MDHFFVRLLTLLLFVVIGSLQVGCQTDQSHHLVGTWVGFPLSTARGSGYFSAEEAAETKVTVEFSGDGLFTMTLSGPSKSEDVVRGSWNSNLGDSATERTAVLKTDDSRSLRWQIQVEPNSTRFSAIEIDGDSRIGFVEYVKQ